MGLEGHEQRRMKCSRCRREYDSRLSFYGFLLLGFRGRDAGPKPAELEAVLCAPCARELREDLLLYLQGASLNGLSRGVIHCGVAIRNG